MTPVPELTIKSEGRPRSPPRHFALANGTETMVVPVPLSRALSPKERAMKRFEVEGNAIVTGGSGGLGLACVRALLEHGASGVCIMDIPSSMKLASSAIAELKHDFPNATLLVKSADVSDEHAVRGAVQASAAELGSIDMMLCFAGIIQSKQSMDLTAEEWRRTMDINLTGSWFCAQAAAKEMISQGTGGSIVLTASISGHIINFPQPQIHYNVSKAGVLHLARGLAAEWARHGIRVNTISPGYMDTIMTKGDGLKEEREMWMSQNPMGRLGSPEELAGSVILLCSKVAGKYMTGCDIVVDGGESIF